MHDGKVLSTNVVWSSIHRNTQLETCKVCENNKDGFCRAVSKWCNNAWKSCPLRKKPAIKRRKRRKKVE